MNLQELIDSAKTMSGFDKEAANEYKEKQLSLVETMNKEMLKREDISQLVGEFNLQMMQDNHDNHVRFISSILLEFHAETLVETILWVFRAYRSRGFSSNYWAAQLNTWVNVLKEVLSEKSYKEIYPIYEWMQINIPTFVILSDEKLESNYSLH